MNRRSFAKQTLGSLLTISLLESLYSADAFGKEIQPVTAKWLHDLHLQGEALKGQQMTQVQWQAKTAQLFKQVDLQELLTFVDFDKLTKDLKFRERGERPIRPKFPEVEGLPKKLVFGSQIFALKKGQAVAPHGHNNMATAFLVLKGDFHGRHYDRIEDHDDHLIIKPTIDDKFRPTQYSTISDEKDNIHWFQAKSDVGFIFNIHVLNVDPNVKRNGRVYVDPDGEKLAKGRVKARRLTYREAYDKYGSAMS